MCKRIVKMQAFLLFCSFVTHLLLTNAAAAQLSVEPGEKSVYVKIGLEGALAVIDPKDINDAIEDWINNIPDLVSIRGIEDMRVGFNIDGYIGLVFADIVEIRPEIGYFLAPKIIEVAGSSDLDIYLSAFYPGLSVNLVPAVSKEVRMQLGLGIYQYYGKLRWEESGSPKIELKGNKFGIHAILGIDVRLIENIGINFSMLYKHAKIDDVEDEHGNVLQDFELDLSGVEFRMGGYFAFL